MRSLVVLLLFLHAYLQLFLQPVPCDAYDHFRFILPFGRFPGYYGESICTASRSAIVTVEKLLWTCRYSRYHEIWKCTSETGVTITLTRDERYISDDCLYFTDLNMPGLTFNFDTSSSRNCEHIKIKEVDHDTFTQCTIHLPDRLYPLLNAASGGDAVWSALSDLRHGQRGNSLYRLSRLEMRGAQAASALADPAFPKAVDAALLKELRITNAPLGDALVLPSLPNLLALRVEHCNLLNISAKQPLSVLRKLSVRGNRLRKLPISALGVIPANLREMDMSGNPELIATHGDLEAIAGLETLNMSGVQAVGALLAHHPFPALHHLTHLSLDSCGLHTFMPGIAPFVDLRFLQQLSLKNNKLTEWPKARGDDGNFNPQPLERLDVSNNYLTSIPSYGIQAKHVFASDNNISEWRADSFISHITVTLDFRRNNISVIRAEMLRALRGLRSLEQLTLDGNPLSCDVCKQHAFVEWLDSRTHDLETEDFEKLACVELSPEGERQERRLLTLEQDGPCSALAWAVHVMLPLFAIILAIAVLVLIWLNWQKDILRMVNEARQRLALYRFLHR